MRVRFDQYCRARERAAAAAVLPPYRTTAVDVQSGDFRAIGNEWSRALFDGDFYRTSCKEDTPVTNLVFVESRDGNTGADDSATLGGGDTDKHLIYDGLSRVDADAVLSGATTGRSDDLVFSVWHPELVALRRDRGRARLAIKYSVPLVPFLMNGVLGNPDLISNDGVHPNAAGARFIAETIWECLEPMARKLLASAL